MKEIITNAIKQKKIITFNYHGHLRIVEPHALGIANGLLQVESYQIGGSSATGGLPNWRRFIVNHIPQIIITEQTFNGKRVTPTGKHSSFDTIIAVVD
jgi:hypothetical protein